MNSFINRYNKKGKIVLMLSVFIITCFSFTAISAETMEPSEPDSTIIADNSGNTSVSGSTTEGAEATTVTDDEDTILNDKEEAVDNSDSSAIENTSSDDSSDKNEKDYYVKGNNNSSVDGIWGTVSYTSDQWGWAPENYKNFQKLVEEVKKDEDKGICLIGHTDRFGNKKYNWKLSYRRALIVKNLLVALGIDDVRVGVKGVAYKKPVVKWAKKASDIAKNRRVEIKVVDAGVLCGNLKTPPDYIVK